VLQLSDKRRKYYRTRAIVEWRRHAANVASFLPSGRRQIFTLHHQPSSFCNSLGMHAVRVKRGVLQNITASRQFLPTALSWNSTTPTPTYPRGSSLGCRRVGRVGEDVRDVSVSVSWNAGFSTRDNAIASVSPYVCLSVCPHFSILPFEPSDL